MALISKFAQNYLYLYCSRKIQLEYAAQIGCIVSEYNRLHIKYLGSPLKSKFHILIHYSR